VSIDNVVNDSVRRELFICPIDTEAKTACFLLSVLVPLGLTHIDVCGDYVALLCQLSARVNHIITFSIGESCRVVCGPSVRVSCLVRSYYIAFTATEFV
jgi:hypothetical protein